MASASSNGRVRAQSITVRSGVVTPSTTWSSATFAQWIETPSRCSGESLRPRLTISSGTGGCSLSAHP